MKVLINGRYAYQTDLEDVEVGDEMLLPGSQYSGSWAGIVTALEPDYDGHCRKALGLTRRRAQVEEERAALAQVKITGWRVGDKLSKPCHSCGEQRDYTVEEVNKLGRPTSVRAEACTCGAVATGAGLGSAEAFRHFIVDPHL